MLLITRIRTDVQGQVQEVEWQNTDTGLNIFLGRPIFARLTEVVDLLDSGQPVGTLFPGGPGHHSLGPKIEVVWNVGGQRTIACMGDELSLQELPRLPSLEQGALHPSEEP